MRQYLAVLALTLAACAGESAHSLAVSASVTPGPGATGVSRTSPVSMDAGVVMDTAYCRGKMTLQVGDSAGATVPATMAWSNGGRTMTLRPDSMLAANTTYFVHVRDSMMTSSGTMTGGGMMGGGTMSGENAMMMQVPAGGMKMSDGMGWTFTTGN